jgi:hypothetical protein
MGQMHRVLAMAVLLGVGVMALSLLGAEARRGSGEVAQMQRVEPTAAVATTEGGRRRQRGRHLHRPRA